MLGLTLNIWTDVKGISKNSGVSANPPSVSGVVTAKSTFGIHANIIHNSLSQVNITTLAKTTATGTIVSPATSMVAANSAFGIHANIIHNTLPQVNTIANVNIVKITKG